MSERQLQRDVFVALGAEPGLVLMRNQVGRGERFDTRTHDVRHETYGLGVGSPDIVGILGPTGRWFCLELKATKGRMTMEQAQWHSMARSMGAFVAVARSVDEARAALERARNGESE